jgi:hypothetical protein
MVALDRKNCNFFILVLQISVLRAVLSVHRIEVELTWNLTVALPLNCGLKPR